MIYIALAAALCIPFLLEVLHARERREWARERGELLNRIQRPDILPTRPVQEFVTPERELDEWNKVGTIELDMNGGEDG